MNAIKSQIKNLHKHQNRDNVLVIHLKEGECN